jgi:hypothetical protein
MYGYMRIMLFFALVRPSASVVCSVFGDCQPIARHGLIRRADVGRFFLPQSLSHYSQSFSTYFCMISPISQC